MYYYYYYYYFYLFLNHYTMLHEREWSKTIFLEKMSRITSTKQSVGSIFTSTPWSHDPRGLYVNNLLYIKA